MAVANQGRVEDAGSGLSNDLLVGTELALRAGRAIDDDLLVAKFQVASEVGLPSPADVGRLLALDAAEHRRVIFS